MKLRERWKALLRRGTSPKMPLTQRKQIELVNLISLAGGAFMAAGTTFFALRGMPVATVACAVGMAANLLAWVAIGKGRVRLGKMVHIIFGSSIFLAIFTFKVEQIGSLFSFSLVTMVMPVLPLILLDPHREKRLLYSILVFDFIAFLTIEPIIFSLTDAFTPTQVGGHRYDYYGFVKSTQLAAYLFTISSILFLRRVNARAELRLQENEDQLMVQNEELQANQEELTMQNDQLEYALGQLRNTQSQLIHAEKMSGLGQLTAGIAHELNNPINGVHSGVEGLRAAIDQITGLLDLYETIDAQDLEGVKETLANIAAYKQKMRYQRMIGLVKKMPDTIAIGAQRAAQIVRELRTFSRLDEADLKQANLHEGISSTLLLLHNQYQDQVKVVCNFDEAIPLVECYPGRLNQVFLNLITNAIQATKEKELPPEEAGAFQPIVTISTQLCCNAHDVATAVVVQVADNGNGIPKHLQRRIFEPFYTTKPVGKGTGLGLSVASSIMEEHHGGLEVESQQGLGTIITARLPLRQPQPDAETLPMAKAS